MENKFASYESLSNDIMNKILYGFNICNTILYHYTSPEGLHGILKDRNLWFTRVDYLNDKTELKYIFEVLEMVLHSEHQYSQSLKKLLFDKFFKHGDNGSSLYHTHTYICSFSLASDELNLWNYYTKTDVKAGYNIGYNCEALFSKHLDNKDCYPNFGSVIYDFKEQESILNQLLECLSSIYETLSDEDVDIALAHFSSSLWDLAPFFKHPAFENEQEMRMLLVIDEIPENLRESYKLSVKNGIFVPHLEIPFDINSVKLITYSPYIKSEHVKTSIKDLLRFNNYEENIEIKKSNIPVEY